MDDTRLQKLIIWDWEGTIVDSRLVLWQILNTGLISLGIPLIDIDTWYAVLPHNRRLDTLLHTLIPHIEYEDYIYLLSLCEQKMTKLAVAPVIPGMHDVITQLKNIGVELAVASNKETVSLRKDIEHVGLAKDFLLCLGSGHYQPKPSPDMLEAIIDSLGASPADTLMIGDSLADMEAARSAKVVGLGLDYGSKNEASLLQSGAKVVVHSPKALLSVIKAHLT